MDKEAWKTMTNWPSFALFALGLNILLLPIFAKAEVKVGDRAPDFELPDQWGNRVRLSGFKGKKAVVLAFYIKAGTPG